MLLGKIIDAEKKITIARCVTGLPQNESEFLEGLTFEIPSKDGMSKKSERILGMKDLRSLTTASDMIGMVLLSSVHQITILNDQYQQVFYKEVEERISSACFGRFGLERAAVVFIAHDCHVQGFALNGEEVYWNIMSDTVCLLGLADFVEKESNCLFVGHKDSTLSIYRDVSPLSVVQEVSPFQLVTFHGEGSRSFAFALESGVFGVIDGDNKLWRHKSKSRVTAQCLHNLSGKRYLATSWDSGKIDLRSWSDGDILFRTTDVAPALDVASIEGFLVVFSQDKKLSTFSAADLTSSVNHEVVFEHTQDLLRRMLAKKQQLITQLTYLEKRRNRKSSDTAPESPCRVYISLQKSSSATQGGIEFRFEAVPPMKMLMARCGPLFPEGMSVVTAKESSNTMSMLVQTPKDVPYILDFKVFLESGISSSCGVFETSRNLAQFSMFYPIDGDFEETSKVTFRMPCTESKLHRWFSSSIFLTREVKALGGSFCERFMHLRGGAKVELKFDVDGSVAVRSESLKIASDLTQSIASFFGISDLSSRVFSEDIKGVVKALKEADKLQSANVDVQRQIVSLGSLVKEALLRGADALALEDLDLYTVALDNLDDSYKEIEKLQGEKKFSQDRLLDILKGVNQVIQNAANCRTGNKRAAVLTEARRLIREKQFDLVSGVLANADSET